SSADRTDGAASGKHWHGDRSCSGGRACWNGHHLPVRGLAAPVFRERRPRTRARILVAALFGAVSVLPRTPAGARAATRVHRFHQEDGSSVLINANLDSFDAIGIEGQM